MRASCSLRLRNLMGLKLITRVRIFGQSASCEGIHTHFLRNTHSLLYFAFLPVHVTLISGATIFVIPLDCRYWVRPEFVTAIKYVVSQRLPVSIFGAAKSDYDARSDAQLVNSVSCPLFGFLFLPLL